MATLYRKYRPQNFQEVVGQNHIKVTLEHEIESDKLAHAYLFCGPRAVGKTTLARVFAKAINCIKRKSGEHEPCNNCDICKNITAGHNLDIIEIDAASHTGVDNVRENIIAVSRVSPSSLKFKVFIIDEAHMLSIQAFNALLKVLEEPPPNIIFILATTEVHKVPETIISRCQRFDFRRISVIDIMKKLRYIVNNEELKIADEILEDIARHSEGYMRDAESLLGQVVAIGGKEVTREEADLVIPRSDLNEAITLVGLLAKKDAGKAIALVNKLLDEGIELVRFTRDVIELLRKIMLAKINPALSDKLGLELGETLEVRIGEISKELEVKQLIFFIEKFYEARNELKSAFLLQLPLELAIAEICLGVGLAIKTPVVKPAAGNNGIKPTVNLNNGSAGKNPEPIKTAVNNPNKFSQLSREHISAKWNEVLIKVKKYNHSLSFILRVCQPRNIAGNQLCLAFKYKFHKERMGDENIKQHVESVLKEVYGQPLIVEAIVDESIEVVNGDNGGGDNNVSDNNGNGQDNINPGETEVKKENAGNGENKMMENLIKTFGGKVVN